MEVRNIPLRKKAPALKKHLLVLIWTLGFLSNLDADTEIAENLSLGTDFYASTDQDRIQEDYYSMGAVLRLNYTLLEHSKFQLEIDAGIDIVRLTEIWGQVQIKNWRLKTGIFENSLLLGDALPFRDSMYGNRNPVRERLDDMGWYSSGALGIHFSRTAESSFPWNIWTHYLFVPSSREMQINGGVLWEYNENSSALGITLSYFPFFIHRLYHAETFYPNANNFFVNAVVGDLLNTHRFVYKFELTFANNLVDPIGYVHFPGSAEASWLWGTTFYGGFPVTKGQLVWTPGLGFAFLIHELSIPESNSLTVTIENSLEWNNLLFLNTNFGLGFNSYYDPNLITALELLWAIEIQVRI